MPDSPPRYVTDTHPLVWHLRRSKRLRPKAREIFRQAATAKALHAPLITQDEELQRIPEI